MVIYYTPKRYKHPKDCWCNACFKKKAVKAKKLPKKPDTYDDYFLYIKSKRWTERKVRYYQRYAKRCCACGIRGQIELHHLKYGNFGHERDEDLCCLCNKCHGEYHALYGSKGNIHKQTALFIKNKQKNIRSIIDTFLGKGV